MPTPRSRRSVLAGLLAAPLLLGLAACGDDSGSSDGTATDASDASDGDAATAEDVTLHLGYFPNVTHAPALVGVGSSRRTCLGT